MAKFKVKPFWKSKTVLAAAASLVVAVATAVGGETSATTAVLIAVFSALGVYGRSVANTSIR